MSSRRGLAIVFISVIAAAVSFVATYPRWHPARSSTNTANNSAETVPAALAPDTAGVLPSLTATPAPLAWAKLSVNQRTALAPFAREWDQFSDVRKRKWLKIAVQYPKLSLDEQARLHERMAEWVSMTADQRRTARENFQLSKAVPVQQREKAWADYQRLPEDQKKKLAATERKSHRQTVVSTPLTGKKEIKDITPPHRPPEPSKAPTAPLGGTSPGAKPVATTAAPVSVPAAVDPHVAPPVPHPMPSASPLWGEHVEQ
ncbi:DUF3106 domain-containing protein [Burkholderia sp. L27(2015)]|uniref:DUF3106 domain-containing protein n=1 Tax=Burkholderia sp. L27(2015) TaxID=1641858 RepID=UPI00131CF5C5|nr:DUF3106 domain-containing protein [Burkholderia sp. L27(2015)]